MDHTLLSQHRAAKIWRFVFSVCLVPALALANPVGESLRFGDVDFVRNGNRLDVIQRSNQAIIDWSAFSIANGEITDFSQPGAGAAALNRVTGISASQIDGLLRSNGRILLLNPNGILIGPNGRVDTASFVASTLDISDADFLTGGDLPLRGASQASVINLGTISAFDGDVFLVAASVENHGSIFAPNGTAGLAAGNDVLIRESGEERVWVRGASGETKDDGVINSGTVEANIAELKSYGGNVYGMAVKNEGRVAATGVTRQGGQIFLSAGGGRSKIRSTGQLVAKRPATKSGGNISIRNSGAESKTEVGGTVDVRSTDPEGHGGDVLILGTQIDILPDTVILADGESGGGRVQIGGGRRGENLDFNNAKFVSVAEGVLIDASATVSGDGGEVILFAEDTLNFFGHAAVRGGDASGDGGFVELSGKRKVNFDGFVKAADTSASNGANGSLFFDPIDVLIQSRGESTGSPIMNGVVNDRTILFAEDISSYLENSGNLEIRSDGSGFDNGDITFSSSAVVSWTNSSLFTVTASGSLVFQANSGINAGLGSIVLQNLAGTADGILVGSDVQITSGGGDITLLGQGSILNSGSHSGIRMNSGSNIATSGTGIITLTGKGGTSTGMSRGVMIAGGATVAAEDGNIIIDGTGGSGGDQNEGVKITDSGTGVSTDNGNITITGVGGNGGSGFSQDNDGVEIANGAGVEARVSGDLKVMGTDSGSGRGIDFDSAGIFQTRSGDIELDGKGTGEGLRMSNSAVITLSGGISVVGEGGSPNTAIRAGYLEADTVSIRSNGGDVFFADFGSISATTLSLSSSSSTPVGFQFFNGETDLDFLEVLTPIESIELTNTKSLSVGPIHASGYIDLQASNTLTTTGILESPQGEIYLGANTLNLNHGVFAGTEIVTGPPAEVPESFEIDFGSASFDVEGASETPGHTLNALVGLFSPSVSIFGSDLSDVFNVESLGDRNTGGTAEVFGYLGFDTLNVGNIDLEATTLTEVEEVQGMGAFSTIFGKDSNETYTFAGANNVTNGGSTFSGFQFLRSGTGNDVFQLSAGLSSAPFVDDTGGTDTVHTALMMNDVFFMDEDDEVTINGVIDLGGVEIIDANSGNDTFNLEFGASARQLIGGLGYDRINALGAFEIGNGELFGIEEIRGTGSNDILASRNFEPAQGTVSRPDSFRLSSSGSIRSEGVDYLGFEQLWMGDAADTVSVESGFSESLQIRGGGGIDTLAADNADANVFSITSDFAGNLNGNIQFQSIEKLKGGTGADQFNFSNQATVESVDGNTGNDQLTIDDTNLDGINVYNVSDGLVSRNPQYRFSSVESIQLFLGSGNDTVDVSEVGFDLDLDGGGGIDTLLTTGSTVLDGKPISNGDSTITYTGFEAPLGFLIFDVGDLLTLELGQNEEDIPVFAIGDESGNGNFLIEYNFNENGEIEGFNLLGLSEGGAGFFGAAPAAAAAALANLGQAVVITVDGGQFLLDSPASLDGTFAQPSFEGIAALRESLSPTANGELARALEFLGGAFLIGQDGATAIDLSGPPPPALLALLQESLAIGAAQELAGALGIVIALPLTSIDGPTVIGLVVIRPGPETLQALLDHLGAAAENELQGALGN